MIFLSNRVLGVICGVSLALFLTFGLLMALPVEAKEALSVRASSAEGCSALSSDDQAAVNCAYGYVFVDGEPVEAQVEIRSDQGSLVVETSSSEESEAPHYTLLLSDTLALYPSDWVTFTVSYDGFTAIRRHQVMTGTQQVDLVINRFPNGRFERTDLVSDTVGLVNAPTEGIVVNDHIGDVQRILPTLGTNASGNVDLIWSTQSNDVARLDSSRSFDGGQNWRSETLVYDDPNPFHQLFATMVIDDEGTIYAAWTELNSINSPHFVVNIYFAKSTNGGQSWSDPVRVENYSNDSQAPALALDEQGNLYVAWIDISKRKADFYFAKSTDGGATWSDRVKVNEVPSTLGFELVNLMPSLVVDRHGTLYLAWSDNRDGSFDIYFARSDDQGESWSPNLRLHESQANHQLTPKLLVDQESTLYVVWQDARAGTGKYKIYFAKSTDGGSTWHEDLLYQPSEGAAQHDAQFVLDQQENLYVAWRETYNDKSNMLLARSTDKGQTWRLIGAVNDPNHTIHLDQLIPISPPGLAIDQSGARSVYLAWPVERSETASDIYVASWPDKDHFYTDGNYTSEVYDARQVVGWREWDAPLTLPVSSTLALEVRTGHTATPDEGWSEWQRFASWPADLSGLPHSQYLEWRVHFSSTLSTTTPSLGAIKLTTESPAVIPEIQLNPELVLIQAEEGGDAPAARLLEIRNGGTGTFNWSATTETDWLRLGSRSGTAPATVEVQADSSGLAAGTYVGEVTVSGEGVPNSPRTVQVVLRVLPPGQPVWTLMFYVAADNDLVFSLKHKHTALQEAAQHPNLNILVLMDTNGYGDTRLYHVLPETLLTYKPDYVPWLRNEMNMGDPETLRSFVDWGLSAYAADFTYLNVADHGKGAQGIAWDVQSKSYLPASELPDALLAATNTDDADPTNDNPIDVLHYDACLMGLFEGAYDVRGAANYLVASENLAWSLFSFTNYANAAATATSSRDFARDVARLYHEELTIESDTYPETISAIDLSQMEAVKERLNELVGVLNPTLHKNALREARTNTQKFDSRDYYDIDNRDEYLDLYDFALKIQDQIADPLVDQRAQALIESVELAVIAEYHFSDSVFGRYWDLDNSHGLAIFFPSAPSVNAESDYQRYINNRLFAFTEESQYDELMASVLDGLTPIDAPDDEEPPPPPLVYPLTTTEAIPLEVGWNLVSVAGQPDNSDIVQALQPITGSLEIAYTYDGCDAGQPWQKYDPDSPPYTNNLTQIDHTKGLWVNMSVANTLEITTTVPVTTTIPLCSGWNLVGYPSLDERPIADALQPITGTYTIVYAYDATDSDQPWKKYDPNAPPFANTLDVMKPESGYWIHLNQNATWRIVNR